MNTYRTPAKLHVEHRLIGQRQSASIDCIYYCLNDRGWLQCTLPVLNFVVSALWNEDAIWHLEVDGTRYLLDLREQTLHIHAGELDLMQCGVEDLVFLYSGEAA